MTNDTTRADSPSRQAAVNEEPEIAFEESIPSDGKDEVGEKMMEDLGRDKAKNEAPPSAPVEPMPEQFPAS
ncbi:hypothetical protein QTI24_04720 [Variovorax sp. J22P240]|uniref:hypothetical protein n=1 Tax=Variovorax sp. J22P240 TaxID=3053514 RepID=UPI0025758212|nr:hypothetical protein [Variovorax sp. J22P240]MDL9997895.1 hypothetical protein [Variovorax sp. J22P240]